MRLIEVCLYSSFMSVDGEGSEPLLSSHRVLVLEGSTSPPAQLTRESPFSNRVCSVSNGSVDLLRSGCGIRVWAWCEGVRGG